MYGKLSADELRKLEMSRRTIPPPELDGIDLSLLCNKMHFDAICSHWVNSEYRTYAFIGKYYLEIGEFGPLKVLLSTTIFYRLVF